MRVLSGGTATPREIGTELHVYDEPLLPSSASAMVARYRTGSVANIVAPASFWPTVAGAPAQVVDVLTFGTLAHRCVSAVATITGRSSPYTFPLAKNFALIPQRARVIRRHTFRCIAWRDALTAGVGYGIGVCGNVTNVAPLNFNGGGGVHGFELYSIAALNGGNWTVRSRLTGVGAPVNGIDTGVTPLGNPTLMEFIYQEGLVPTFEIRCNGVSVFQAAGLANLPPATLNEVLSPRFVQGDNPGSAVGATDWLALAEYLLETV